GMPGEAAGRERAARRADVLAVGEERVVPAEGLAEAVGAELGEARIGVDQHPPPALLQLRDPGDVAQVQVEIALGAPAGEPLARHPVSRSVLGQVAPDAVQPVAAHQPSGVGDAVARIGGHDTAARVVARFRPPEVLDEGHVVAQPVQAEQVLEVMPAVAAHRVADEVAGAEDAEPHAGQPSACASRSPRTRPESKCSSASARAALAWASGSASTRRAASTASSASAKAKSPSPSGIRARNPVSWTIAGTPSAR